MWVSLLLVAIINACGGHICPISPQARGPIDISMPGAPSCYLRTGPCGGVPRGSTVTHYITGQSVDVLFQQNLNHYWVERPGVIDISIQYTGYTEWTCLSSISDFPAHEMVTQTNITRRIDIPFQVGPATLRYRYISNNPAEVDPASNTDAIFYNCADIFVSAPAAKEKRATQSAAAETGEREVTFSCNTPPQFQYGANVVSGKSRTMKNILWDSLGHKTVSQTMNYIDRTLDVYSFNDYHAGKEWVYWPNRKPAHCELYGPDAWYDWTFGEGAQSGNVFVENITHTNIAVFRGPGNQVTWFANRTFNGFCQPLGKLWPGGEETPNEFRQFKFQPGWFNLQLPAACKNVNVFSAK